MIRKTLMTPGPSPVPSVVREALGQEIMHHRTSEFQAILKNVHAGLRDIFITKNPVLILASSGTGAMEAAVSNLFSKGEKVIGISGGKFGERWSEISRAYGLDVIEMQVEWGTSPTPEAVGKLIDENPGVKGVMTTLSETSTATTFDVEGIAKVTNKKDILLLVDAISGLGQDRLYTDKWGVDVVVSGSQKGFMLPPGLGFISLSKRAQKALENSDLPKYYFDLKKALKTYEKDDTPYTPAVSLIVGLQKAIEIIKSDMNTRWERFEKMAQATQEAAKAIGLGVFSKSPSASVTAITVPENIKSSDVVKKLRTEYGLSIAGGQAQLKDKIIRVAHMGWINEQDLIAAFSLIEKALKDVGHKFNVGASVAKLQEVFYG